MGKSLDARTQNESLVVDEDIVRRTALNRERTPVSRDVTVYGEATQTLNPLTGETYDFRNVPLPYDASLLFQLYEEQVNAEHQATSTVNPITGRDYSQEVEKAELSGELGSVRFVGHDKVSYLSVRKIIFNSLDFVPTPTTEAFELQRALGRMDVRDGKLARADYDAFSGALHRYAGRVSEAGLPLDVITDAAGVNNAVANQEKIDSYSIAKELNFVNESYKGDFMQKMFEPYFKQEKYYIKFKH